MGKTYIRFLMEVRIDATFRLLMEMKKMLEKLPLTWNDDINTIPKILKFKSRNKTNEY